VNYLRRLDEQRTLRPPSVDPAYLAFTTGSLFAAPGERLSVSRALGLADVFACARVLVESAASLPLHPYRRIDRGRERAGGRVAALLERPGPGQTTSAFIAHAMTSLVLHGAATIGKFREDGEITQLGVIDPTQVRPKVVRGELVIEIHRPEGLIEVGTDDVVYVRGMLSRDGLTGLSPIAAVRESLGLADALAVQSRSFAQRAARPSGILKLDARGSHEQLQTLKDIFSARHGGPEQAGQIAVMSGDVEWSQLSIDLADAQWVEQRNLSTAEIARIFRVPAWMIGAASGDSLTYSNTESQASSFVTFSLRPWLVAIEQAISADRDLCPGGLYVEFLLDALLRADSKTRAEVYTAALDPITGWMSREEVRELENLGREDERPAMPVAPPPAAIATNGGS
jgi:HK97 family phage portal protein